MGSQLFGDVEIKTSSRTRNATLRIPVYRNRLQELTDLLDQYFRVDSGLRQLGLHFRERLLLSPEAKKKRAEMIQEKK